MVITSTQKNQNSNINQLMRDRIVLITGASRGIGAATAKLLGHHGAAVGINYYNSEAAALALVEEISSDGGKAKAVKADVRNLQQVNAMLEQISEAFGAIDTLVINANASFPIAPFVNYRWEDFEAKLLGELKGAFFPCKAVVPSMIEHQRGCIIAVSSGLSRASLSGANLSKANLSKANLRGADLCDANLSEADLTDADLSAAFLLRANLTGAKLDGANFSWAVLTEVTPPDIDLNNAIISRTILPGGYPSDEQGNDYANKKNRYFQKICNYNHNLT